jgi:hypothetical protein
MPFPNSTLPALAFEEADLLARGRVEDRVKRVHGATAPFAQAVVKAVSNRY